jgi:hypothetical protein
MSIIVQLCWFIFLRTFKTENHHALLAFVHNRGINVSHLMIYCAKLEGVFVTVWSCIMLRIFATNVMMPLALSYALLLTLSNLKHSRHHAPN